MIKKYLIFILVLFIFPYSVKAQSVLTWSDCLKQAQATHPDLIAAKEAIKESQANRMIKLSPMLPQVDSSLSFSRSKVSGSKEADSYAYGLSASQILFDGFKNFNNVKVAEEGIKYSQLDYSFTDSDVLLRLRTAFVNLVKSQELLSIVNEIYDIRRQSLELITLRYESGTEHKGALLNSEANLMSAKFDIEKTKRSLDIAKRQLVKEMGKNDFTDFKAEGFLVLKNINLDKPDFEVLADNHPNYKKAITQTNSALFGIKSTKAEFLPQISADTGASKTDAHWPPENSRWNAGVSLALPIFEGGLRTAQLDQAQSNYKQLKENERSTRDGILVDLEEKWASLQDAITTVEVQQKYLEAAQERAKIAEAQYSLGLIKFDDWTLIQDDLVRFKKSFLEAQANALLAQANWVAAKGETLEYAN